MICILTTDDTESTEDYNRTVKGTLVIDKPAGMTSHDVVARVRRLTGLRRVGHTGTLDPFATGVLVVLLGKATRLLQFLSGAEKEYRAVIRFGYATDTGDLTGRRLDSQTQPSETLCAANIESAMAGLRGEIKQVPPMYSAKKVDGRKLYELARRGEEIERAPVSVTISEFVVDEHGGPSLTVRDDGTADLKVRVTCSAGTYVRTLAEDLGKRLEMGAHLNALRRTRAGRFSIESAITLEQLTKLANANSIGDKIISLDATIGHLPPVVLNEGDVRQVVNGVAVEIAAGHLDQQRLRLQNVAGDLVAVGIFEAGLGIVRPDVVLAE